ncbi:MAG: type I-C CRISPR-associated protein Cas5c [Clostridiales bacterium]|nr:type I-C CRISPR-associated protein Cas5c [Clostridiales bacterium]
MSFGFGFIVEVCGEYALFTRPELKVERVSYEVITPSAARGLFEAVMWKPAIKYFIDEIAVCSEIKLENIRRNEVDFKISIGSMSPKSAVEGRQQRAALVLKDVRYVITAHFEMTDRAEALDNEGKFTEMISRRLKNGQNFHTPYLGTREFPAKIRLIEDDEIAPEPINETRSLGLMFYDMDYVTEKDKAGDTIIKEFLPKYFMAKMEKGVIDLRNVEVMR